MPCKWYAVEKGERLWRIDFCTSGHGLNENEENMTADAGRWCEACSKTTEQRREEIVNLFGGEYKIRGLWETGMDDVFDRHTERDAKCSTKCK